MSVGLGSTGLILEGRPDPVSFIGLKGISGMLKIRPVIAETRPSPLDVRPSPTAGLGRGGMVSGTSATVDGISPVTETLNSPTVEPVRRLAVSVGIEQLGDGRIMPEPILLDQGRSLTRPREDRELDSAGDTRSGGILQPLSLIVIGGPKQRCIRATGSTVSLGLRMRSRLVQIKIAWSDPPERLSVPVPGPGFDGIELRSMKILISIYLEGRMSVRVNNIGFFRALGSS